ncbi:hypothetical protein BH09PAT2_BH09PAT2_06620 [soil metagenome]
MTLTEINFYVRKSAPLAIIVVLVLLTLFFAIRLVLLINSVNPNTPTASAANIKLNTVFNKITPLEIANVGTSGNFTYTLDTLDGTANADTATSAASVFFLRKPAPSFGFLDEIYGMAKTAGIDTEITKHVLTDRIATFDDGRRKLTIDIDNFNFNYEYYLDRDEELFNRNLTTATQLEGQGSGFLTKMGKYNPELAKGKRNTIYLRYEKDTKQISSLESAENANMVEVDYYRPDIDGFPVVTTSYYNSPDYVMFAAKGNAYEVVKAQIKYFEKTTDQIGTYPLRTADQAFDDLKKGKGLVISAGQPDGEIKIKKVFLAYYDPDVYQEYMQPVYVFLGENKFVGYVKAVTDEYLSTP